MQNNKYVIDNYKYCIYYKTVHIVKKYNNIDVHYDD